MEGEKGECRLLPTPQRERPKGGSGGRGARSSTPRLLSRRGMGRGGVSWMGPKENVGELPTCVTGVSLRAQAYDSSDPHPGESVGWGDGVVVVPRGVAVDDQRPHDEARMREPRTGWGCSDDVTPQNHMCAHVAPFPTVISKRQHRRERSDIWGPGDHPLVHSHIPTPHLIGFNGPQAMFYVWRW